MSAAVEALREPLALAQENLLAISKKRHPLLAEVIVRNGLIDIRSSRDDCIVEFLAGTVVSQQLSSQAASTIWSRVSALSKRKRGGFRSLFIARHFDELRECGISRAKVKAIIQMAESCNSGTIKESEVLQSDYEQISETVTSLWGFGQWSADMVAMFFIKLPDVWPESDAALIRGLQGLAPGEDPEEVATFYSPHRTYLARHIWRALDTGLIVGSTS